MWMHVFMQYKTTCNLEFSWKSSKFYKFIKCSILANKMEQQLKFYHPAFVKSLVFKSMIINTIENKNTLTLEPEEFSANSFLGLQRSSLQLCMTGNTIFKNSNIYITFCLCFVFCLLSRNLSRVYVYIFEQKVDEEPLGFSWWCVFLWNGRKHSWSHYMLYIYL